MERFKDFLQSCLGLLVGLAYVMCAIGSFGYLINDGHYIFAVVNVVVVVFATKPVKDFFVKNVLL